jgi:putative sterol carrier protein
VQFLSPEWIEALDRAARRHDGLARLAASTDLVIEQVVTDTPHGEVRYRIVLHAGAVAVRDCTGGDPTHGEEGTATPVVTLRMDLDTATAIARHQQPPQTAFLAGRLRIAGDLGALLAHQDALAQVGDVFGEVRAATRW